MDLEAWLETLRQLHPAVVYGALVAGALIEYLVPPFPGDTVVVAGAALVGAFGWPVLPVLAAVTGGAVLGTWIDFAVGRWLVTSGRLDRLSPRNRAVIDDLVQGFERRGAAFLVTNRFVPGVRALFFVAAGVAGLRLRTVLLWSLVSAGLWNGLLVAGGLLLGANVERLADLVERYTLVAGGVVALVLVAVTWRAVRVWRRAGHQSGE